MVAITPCVMKPRHAERDDYIAIARFFRQRLVGQRHFVAEFCCKSCN